ncbi:PepSY domain-containing protein, partial [Pseudomonas shirazensis]
GGRGVPPLRHDLPRWKTATVVMLVLGVAFPLVGASMLVMWVVDRCVVRRRAVVSV